jgi:hypothetical protein
MHFSILILGENPEQQLEPYEEMSGHSGASTSKYIQPVDMEIKKGISLEEVQDEFYNFDVIEDENLVDENVSSNGYIVVKNGIPEKAVRFYNPNGKWDWYRFGGRFKYYLRDSQGFPLVQGVLKGIDFEKTYNFNYEKAMNDYSIIERAYGGIIPKVEISWDSLFEPNSPYYELDICDKRILYRYQEAFLKEWKIFNQDEEELLKYASSNLSNFQCSKEEYAEGKAMKYIVTESLLINGDWYERGDSSDFDWAIKYLELLADQPEDIPFSLYDYHC